MTNPETVGDTLPGVPSPDDNIATQSAYFDEHPEDVKPEHLHNFYQKLYGSKERSEIDSHKKVFSPYLEQPLSKIVVDSLGHNPALYSKKRLNQAVQEFLDTLDEEASIVLVTMEAWELLDQIKNLRSNSEEFRNSKSRLDKLLVPLYVRLRELGYRHYELVK